MSAEPTYQLEPELRFGMPRPARIKAQAWAEVRAIALIGVKESGDTVPVTFLPEQPSTHRLGHVGDRRVRSRSVDWGLGLLGGSGLLGLLAGAMFAQHCQELRLTRDGIPVAGIVSDCAAPPPNAKTTDYTVTFRFTTPDGEQTQAGFVSAEVGKQLAAEQTVTVLYDAANPRRSCLYCALRYTEVA